MPRQERAIATREKLVEAAGQVFASMHFETARVADILKASSVTQGAFYFHFPEGKKQIAALIIERQNNRFVQLRDGVSGSNLDGLSGLLELADLLGHLLQSDPITQAGIRLVTQSSTLFPDVAHLPDPTWLEAISAYLYRAEGEGNLRSDVDISLSARTIVYLFTGAQVSSFVNDSWEQLPYALATIEPYVLQALAVDGFTPTRGSE
ncbi:TetR/AcrR family transcriptional regulator [Candidatus Saccharibacteria bacterium]|nr:TetR/AcrR family transcriptional regulator [Candidatus Saccharibacteria bacterium]